METEGADKNMDKAAKRACDILVVEDNANDVRLLREVLRDRGLTCSLRVASDGAEALRMLRRQGEHAGHKLPDLVLLDINLPILSGIEVLTAIKADPDLRVLPVLMLTTSSADGDVLRCYQLHANSYLVKPVDFDQFTEMIGVVHDFWLGQVQPPALPGGVPVPRGGRRG